MTVTVVDPIGAYNTANGTAWDGHWFNGAKGVYIPAIDEFWFMLQARQGPPDSGSLPSPNGAHPTKSRVLRIDQATGAYVGLCSQPAGQTDKLWLWSEMQNCVVAQKVVVAGSYMTSVGGTIVGGHCLICWNYDGTVAWETFWVEFGGGGYRWIDFIVTNPTLAEVYVIQNSTGSNRKIQLLNMTTGARTDKLTYTEGSGGYRPSMMNDGTVYVASAGSGTSLELRLVLTGTPSSTTIFSVATSVGNVTIQVYDPITDRAYFSVYTISTATRVWKYYSAGSLIDVTPNALSANGWPQTRPEYMDTRTGYFASTQSLLHTDVFLLDTATLATFKTITEPSATAARFMFMVTPTRGWWAIAPGTNWTFGIWTEGGARRRVSLAVIT
ncbi:MAG: hypothetical protein KA763_15070 [Xanthomonadales bacterium]|nr:hypothetical protein [Xanthomonadales bacterium]